MRQYTPRTYLLTSAAIAGTVLGADLVRLVTTGRVPSSELRHAALAAATLLAALGLTSRHTFQTLELARRVEYARIAGGAYPRAARVPAQPPRAAPAERVG